VETLKTAVIVVLLLAVLYGVYLVLNKTDATPPPEIAWDDQAMEPLQIEYADAGPAASFATDEPSVGMQSSADRFSTPSIPAPNPGVESTEPQDPDPLIDAPWNTDMSADGGTPTPEPPTETADDAIAAALQPQVPFPEPDTATEPADSPIPAAESELEADPYASIWPPKEESTVPEGAPANEPATSSVERPSAEDTAPSMSAFHSALQSAEAKIAEEQWYEALYTLTVFYSSPDLSEQERDQLLDLLDPLAARVIYSSENHINAPHDVRAGETLESIAESQQIPWQLLANINEIENPQFLQPGTKLKVVPGPFRAEIDLRRPEMTLFVGRLYAGRFPISVGSDPMPQPGEYRIYDKQAGRTYYAGDGRTVPADNESNPYGKVWIDLGGDLCIHGSPENGRLTEGCISLSPVDANDVYAILSKGSRVTIRR